MSKPVDSLDNSVDELETIAGLKSRDEEAFRLVVRRYHLMVLNCAYKFLRNKESAEDLTQEVFMEVARSIRLFRGDAQLSTWIYRITVTKCLNQIKHQHRQKRFADLVSLFSDPELAERIPSPESSDPALQVERIERQEVVNNALRRLPDSQRIAYTLSKVEGFSYEEIAAVMKTSVPSVESLIHRAKANLVRRLRAYYASHLS